MSFSPVHRRNIHSWNTGPASRALSVAILVAIAVVLWPNAKASATPALSIYVSILPQQYLVERIGQPYVTVTTMVGPGRSPETYEPSPRQMSGLQNCRAYLRMELPFEKQWMSRIAQTNPHMRVVNVNVPETNTFNNGQEILDPHTWNSPVLLQTIARNIYNVLIELDPAHKNDYNTNLQQLLQDLKSLDQQIRAELQDSGVTHFLVFHPAWGYYAKTYGLTQLAIEHEGKEPGPRSLVQLIDTAKQLGLHKIFVQAQFNERSVRIIADALHARTVIVDPLAEDVIANLLHFTHLLTEKDAA
jgi:zinc transport system substrate-binding protein